MSVNSLSNWKSYFSMSNNRVYLDDLFRVTLVHKYSYILVWSYSLWTFSWRVVRSFMRDEFLIFIVRLYFCREVLLLDYLKVIIIIWIDTGVWYILCTCVRYRHVRWFDWPCFVWNICFLRKVFLVMFIGSPFSWGVSFSSVTVYSLIPFNFL